MKMVYIASPYAGDIEKNIRFAKAACRYAMEQGCAFVAVHLLYPQFLNDAVPSQRETGIQMGLRVLASCDQIWICGEHISAGMSCEIAEAKRLDIPIREIATEQIQGGIQMKQIGTANVSYYPKEREIELEEAPSPGMKLQL
jgi:hypothetical protein